MYFVFLNQYYPPDAAPTGVMLEGVVRQLVRDGHEVTVLCASGGYAGAGGAKELSDGARLAADEGQGTRDRSPTIIRIGATRFGRGTFVGKLLDYLSYYLGVGWRLLVMRPGPDRIIALTTPPYLSVLARLVSKFRGADHAHWVMDLYPDVMAAHGMLDERSLPYRVLSGLARWGFGGRRCAAVLTLGPDMAERCARVVGVSGRVKWVPLWAGGSGSVDGGRLSVVREEAGRAQSLRRQRGWADDELVVMYSGNMGLGHRFGEILEVVEELSVVGGRLAVEEGLAVENGPRTTFPIRFVFYGGGKRRGEVERFLREHPGAAVELHDYAPGDILTEHLQSADVHLASLDAEWTGTMVPSKLQGIFSAGRPVIFVGDEESSIGRWVRESGGGWVIAPGDVAGLVSALAEARQPGVCAARGRAAEEFAMKHFDRETNVRLVAEVLAE